MKSSPTLPFVLLLSLGACGPAGPDSDTTKAESPADIVHADDSQEDRWNCGEIGASCVGPLGIGECINGRCGATLGECYLPPGDCNEICARDGRPCAELACEGATAFAWKTALEEEAVTLCAIGHEQTSFPLYVACDEPLEELAMAVSCCCSW